jgi:hypothetical protein
MWCVLIGPRGTLLVLLFSFNLKLTEEPIAILFQSAGIKAKQKKVQRSKLKMGETAGTNHTFKLKKYIHFVI